MKNLVLIALVIFAFINPTLSFAMKTSFSNDEIIFPKGKTEIQQFLELLKDPANRKLVKISNEAVTFNEIPQEHSAIFHVGALDYMLYIDDFNNDGKKEFLIIYLNSGSGKNSGVQGAYTVSGKKLVSLNFDDTVVMNLFAEADMSRFHSYLARPFAVHENGKTYLRFQDEMNAKKIYTYVWRKDKFTGVEL